MELPKSLGTESKDVYSTHYYGPDNIGTTLDVAENGYSAVSVHSPVSFGFVNHSGVQNWKALMEYSITPEIVVQNGIPVGYIIRTSGNTKFIPIEDLSYDGSVTLNPMEDVYNPSDREQDRIGRWREITEKNNTRKYFDTPEFGLFVESRHERLSDNEPEKYVTDTHYQGPINRFGEMLSKAETLRQDQKKYEESPEGKQLALEYPENDEGIEYVGVTSIDGVIYAIGRIGGKVALFAGVKSHEYLSSAADHFGMSLEDAVIASLGEENMHLYRKSFDKKFISLSQRVGEERATKQALLEFYQGLAAGAESNPQLRNKYARVIQSLEHDIATVKRYMKLYQQMGKDSNRNENLMHVLMAEAYDNGMETDEEVRDYAENRLSEMNAEDEESPLEKKVKNADLDTESEGDNSDVEGDSDCAEAESDSGEAEAA